MDVLYYESCYIRPRYIDILTHWGQDKMAALFADDIFKCIFLTENAWILINISLKFLPKIQINNISALVQIMAWRRVKSLPTLLIGKMASPYWDGPKNMSGCCFNDNAFFLDGYSQYKDNIVIRPSYIHNRNYLRD